jgi:hypothetical protein
MLGGTKLFILNLPCHVYRFYLLVLYLKLFSVNTVDIHYFLCIIYGMFYSEINDWIELNRFAIEAG